MNDEMIKNPEILSQLGVIKEKLGKLRVLISPILSNTPQEEESELTTAMSDVMNNITYIKYQIDSLIKDVDIN